MLNFCIENDEKFSCQYKRNAQKLEITEIKLNSRKFKKKIERLKMKKYFIFHKKISQSGKFEKMVKCRK